MLDTSRIFSRNICVLLPLMALTFTSLATTVERYSDDLISSYALNVKGPSASGQQLNRIVPLVTTDVQVGPRVQVWTEQTTQR